MRTILCGVLALTAASAAAQRGSTALEQVNAVEQRAVAAARAGNQQGRIAADLELLRLLHGSPDILEALARAYAAAGETAKGVAALQRYADMGLADDDLLSGKDLRYAALAKSPGYAKALAQMRGNEAPMALAATAFSLPDAGLVAEDIDYDPGTRAFFVTSVLEKKIVRIAPDGSARDFAASPDRWPMLALKIDAQRQRVWATEVALQGFAVVPRSAWGRSAVLCFDLKSGRLLERIESEQPTALGDLALTREGDPIVSDGGGGGLYRVANGKLIRVDSADFISPQTPAAEGDAMLVPDYARGIARFDLRTKYAIWMNEDGADPVALSGVDGLYLHRGWLILTQNGTMPERVVLMKLDAAGRRVVATRVIEQNAPGLGDPTHGVVAGDSFYFIANSGWAHLDEQGRVKAGERLSPAKILRYPLP